MTMSNDVLKGGWWTVAAVSLALVAGGCGGEAGSDDGAEGGASEAVSEASDGPASSDGDAVSTAQAASASGGDAVESELADDEGLSAIERIRRAAERKRAEDDRRRAEQAAFAGMWRDATEMGPPAAAGERLRAETVVDNPADTEAFMDFETQRVDIGEVEAIKAYDVEFPFVNTGPDPLVITAINASCGCTALDTEALVNRPIQPGEGGVIRARYTPQGPGQATKLVNVRSNHRGGETVTLRISGNYIPPVKLAATYESVGRVAAADGIELTTMLEARDADAVIERVVFQSAAGINQGDDLFEVSWERVEGDEDRYPAAYELRFETVDRPRTGPFNENAVITVSHRSPESSEVEEETLNFRIVGALQSKLRLADGPQGQFIRVPTVVTGEPFEVSAVLEHEDGEAFSIEGLTFETLAGTTEVRNVEVSHAVEEGADGSRHVLTIRGDATEDTGRFGMNLNIATDLAGEGPLNVRVAGAVRTPTDQQISSASGAATRPVEDGGE